MNVLRGLIRVLRDPQYRRKHATVFRKHARSLGWAPRVASPIFVFGKQRSGTTMLMHVFHLHPEVRAYDESVAGKAFQDFRIRGWEQLADLVQECRFPHVCFKPLADSHLVGEFMERFPEGRFLWMYRDYVAVARSSVLRFPEGTLPVREACAGSSSAHWFHEGLSGQTRGVLLGFRGEELSELDYACLTWWARNRTVLEGPWAADPRFHLLRYEALLQNPGEEFGKLFRMLGLVNEPRAISHIKPRQHRRRDAEQPDARVDVLCRTLLDRLDDARQEKSGRNARNEAPPPDAVQQRIATPVPPARTNVQG